MKHPALTRIALALAAVTAALPAAHATDGYFAHGYGMKSLGMGGAGVATALEPFGGAANPAGLGSPTCRRAGRSRFTRHAADAGR